MNARRTALLLVTLAALTTSACRREQPAPVRAQDGAVRPVVVAADGAVVSADAAADSAPPYPMASAAETEATQVSMSALRASIGFWRIERNARNRCPTMEDLARTPGAAFDPNTMSRDLWGTAFEITCEGRKVRLRSFGPDRRADTPDDIVTE